MERSDLLRASSLPAIRSNSGCPLVFAASPASSPKGATAGLRSVPVGSLHFLSYRGYFELYFHVAITVHGLGIADFGSRIADFPFVGLYGTST